MCTYFTSNTPKRQLFCHAKSWYGYACCLLLFLFSCRPATDRQVDVFIAGGGASGVAAGIQAARMGVQTLIVEETDWLGGMLTAAGVSAIDGNYRLPAGLWGEFRAALIRHYGSADSLKTGWVSNVLFEPSAGNRIFHDMTAAEPGLEIWKNARVTGVRQTNGTWIVQVKKNDGRTETVRAKRLIDATELGDLAALCGVKYDVGMESRSVTGEDIAPEKANGIVQDLTYVAILKDYGKDVTIARPAGYDPAEFACCCINPHCVSPGEPRRMWSKEMMLNYGKLPNGKYMINWPIEGNDYYVNLIELQPEERAEALQKAKDRTLRFVYFIQHELGFNTLGLADDEYPTADKLPYLPYHRESRRIRGAVRFTLNHAAAPYTQPEKLYRTCIAVGDYPVDHHHTRYDGPDALPDLHFYPIPSFGLPLGTLIPECTEGLIVAEKSISVSNIINGATRLQPVVLQIGQAAGALAALSVKENRSVAAVPVREVQEAVLAAGGYLLPYLDVPVGHPLFAVLQRIGSTGILKGEGKQVDWSNQTWFRADTTVLAGELAGLKELYPEAALPEQYDRPLTLQQVTGLAYALAASGEQAPVTALPDPVAAAWQACGFRPYDPERPATRGEAALLIDKILDPFHRKPVDLYGGFLPGR